MARQRLRGESAPSQTVEQEARFAGVTKRRYQQVLQATREDLGLAPPNSGGRPPAAAVQEDAEALDLERMLELQAETIEALVRAAGPATPCMPWASATGGPPCFGSVAGVKPGRAPGGGGPWAGGVLSRWDTDESQRAGGPGAGGVAGFGSCFRRNDGRRIRNRAEGPPCCGSVAGVKPGRAPGLPAPPGSWPNQWRPGGLRRKAAAWLDPPPR